MHSRPQGGRGSCFLCGMDPRGLGPPEIAGAGPGGGAGGCEAACARSACTLLVLRNPSWAMCVRSAGRFFHCSGAQAQQSTRLDSALYLWRPLKCPPWGDLAKNPENPSDDPENSRNGLEQSGMDPGQCRKVLENRQAPRRALALAQQARCVSGLL